MAPYSTLAAAGLIAIGIGALLLPARAAAQFGIATENPDALAFVRAAGVRDVALGSVLLALPDERDRSRALGCIALVGLCDAAIGLGARGPRPAQLIHAAGFVATALLALRGGD
jgi:hypothetical protein